MRRSKNRDRSQLVLDLEPRDRRLIPAAKNVNGLIEALADPLLEAMGERSTDATANEGGAREPEDHA